MQPPRPEHPEDALSSRGRESELPAVARDAAEPSPEEYAEMDRESFASMRMLTLCFFAVVLAVVLGTCVLIG